MNCFECAITTPGATDTAIACCACCGAGLCLEHAHLIALRPPTPSEWTRTITGARRIVCPGCYAFPPSGGYQAGRAAERQAAPANAF